MAMFACLLNACVSFLPSKDARSFSVIRASKGNRAQQMVEGRKVNTRILQRSSYRQSEELKYLYALAQWINKVAVIFATTSTQAYQSMWWGRWSGVEDAEAQQLWQGQHTKHHAMIDLSLAAAYTPLPQMRSCFSNLNVQYNYAGRL